MLWTVVGGLYVALTAPCKGASLTVRQAAGFSRSDLSSSREEISRKSLNSRVKALRVGRGLSQEALAYEVGIDRTYQSQIERGVGNPSPQVLSSISVALKVDLVELLGA